MKLNTHLKSLYRSPLKTILTLVLLAAAAFLFLYNLSEYSMADRKYREARDKYEGVLTVEELPVPEKEDTNEDYFLLTDPTNPGRTFGMLDPADWHQKSLGEETVQKLSALPHISKIERRCMTAGVSPEFYRLDTDQHMYNYAARCVLIATISEIKESFLHNMLDDIPTFSYWRDWKEVYLRDIQVLAGPDNAYLWSLPNQTIFLKILNEDQRDTYVKHFWMESSYRYYMQSCDPGVFPEIEESLIPGRRYVFVLRCVRVVKCLRDHLSVPQQLKRMNVQVLLFQVLYKCGDSFRADAGVFRSDSFPHDLYLADIKSVVMASIPLYDTYGRSAIVRAAITNLSAWLIAAHNEPCPEAASAAPGHVIPVV